MTWGNLTLSIHLSPRGLALRAALLGLAAAPLAGGLAATPATANPAGTGLVISEVYGAGGNTGAAYTADFVELYNPTAAAIDLAGMAIHYRSASGGSGGTPAALTGSVPAGEHWLIKMSAPGAIGSALPTPDTDLTTFAMAAAGGQVALQQGTAIIATSGSTVGVPGIVDFVGATGATSFEAAATTAAASATQSLNRTAAGADTDSNAADFTLATPSPENSGVVMPLEATSPGNRTGQVGVAGSFTLAATGGTSPYSWSATGLPDGVSVAGNGSVSGTPTAAGTYDVTATVTDSAGPPPATDDVTFTFTVIEAASLKPIAEIQGTGAVTPFDGVQVITRGVVTAAYPTGGLNGFYLQTPGADTTPDASDGIFVYGGGSGFATYPTIGDSVEVSGTVGEFNGQTQIAAADAGLTPIASLGTVTPKTQVPGTDCALPGTDCLEGAALDSAREVHEAELYQPTGPWTATDVYDGGPFYQGTTNSSAFRGEIGLAADSEEALVSPTEVIDAQATGQIAARTRYNNAHRIILDDGSSLTYSTTQNQNSPFPWFTPTHTVRVGAATTFISPVVFTGQFGTWRILPQSQVVGAPTGKIGFEQTRPAAPEEVGGDVKLATFNVLNFFPTTGEEFVAMGGGRTCTFFTDRDGARTTNNQCNPNGPRGAANDASLARQRDKIVAAINTVDADIVSLEELENSVQFGKDRDFAIGKLVDALNANAGAGTWAFAPSPATLPPLAEQDVIRNGFIYKPANVALVGGSVVLSDQSSGTEAFADAREPLAQAFKKVGRPDAEAFAVIVNHFKSKGSGTPDPFGQGNANDRRVLQADALVDFASEFKTLRGITRVFLAGDFNAYSEEDPVQVLNAAGYANLESTSDPEEESYNFDGMIGSLDHVLANEAALADVNAVDIWEINAYESLYYEYGRYNTNVTNLYASNPFRSSDHNPEIVGIDTPSGTTPTPTPTPVPNPVPVVLTADAKPTRLKVAKDTSEVKVTITPGASANGEVAAYLGEEKLATAKASAGKATLTVGPFETKGRKKVEIRYAGDASTKAATTYVVLKVRKQAAEARFKVKRAKQRLAVKLATVGYDASGRISVTVGGKTVKTKVKNGKATLSLAGLAKAGRLPARVKVEYSGDVRTKRLVRTVSLR